MWATPRQALWVIARALLLGAGMGLAVYFAGFVPNLRVALSINMTFAGVMWPAFELLAPLYQPTGAATRAPMRMAMTSLVKILALYSALLFLCIGIIRLTSGFNFFRYPSAVFISYLCGLALTGFMNALHTTSSLVEAERARATAEVDKLRMAYLETENERKTVELEEARALQISMLPTEAPHRADIAVAFGMRTATEVGGDYYDCREASDGRLELVLGDATGHGTKAGLLVVAAKTLFQTEVDGSTPAGSLARANLGVKSLRLSRMNMALTRVSLTPGSARLSAAGMPPALHFSAGANSVVEITNEAPPAGQLKRALYHDTEVGFSRGDRLLLFSDGFPECLDPDGEQLGYERAAAAFAGVAERTPAEIVQALFAATDAWARGRPYEDDVSFLVIAGI